MAKINDRKHGSRLIRRLSVEFPVPSLKHLKRIKSLNGYANQVIICDDKQIQEKQNKIDEICNDFHLSDQEIVEVPSDQPLTRLQYEECVKLWPTNFHPNK